jgi:hypothetical protein
MSSGYEGVALKRLLLLAMIAFGAYVTAASVVAPLPAAAAEETWKSEFDRICGQTENAGEMSVDELKKLLEKCDALKPQIEALEATPRKIYLKRLQMCRNLLNYVLESKVRALENK